MLTLFGGYSYDGVVAGIWVLHRGAKSGCKILTLFGGYSYDGVSAGIWVLHTGAKSGCKVVTLFDSNSYNGVSAGIWVIHTGPKSGVIDDGFLQLLLWWCECWYMGHTNRSKSGGSW